ncbi:helix-turn-helix transcriptional regulator [Streptomyces sp. SID10815]|uniref:helix-turn-helix domain-containing protein n=1 Tax=Streptomyces sp. SID10815 TaxID=2706027 RepID=UPI0013C9FC83|nr:helix-turn-helix transcriptional regulator [Streptomyces sp. SID10815]NEA48966.1 helix-turn-helix transcriptional regulator [Streptomyces sp. SID10815]
MASLNVGNLGEYLREQRRNAQLSLRQLADAAGVSNPYLSQIERGLRKPSAEVLQQVAKALRISAETLYVRAGILDAERDGDERRREGATRAAVLADPELTEGQKQVLLQVYESFRKENGFGTGKTDKTDTTEAGHRSERAHGDGADGLRTADDPGGADSADSADGVIRSAAVPDPDGGRRGAVAESGRRTRRSGGDADPREAAG